MVLVPLVGVYRASFWGPPPPSIPAIGVSVVILLLLAGPLGAWADRAATPAELTGPPHPVK